jgi:cytosine/adenosine deaminase-related metal-dependent hydrolase
MLRFATLDAARTLKLDDRVGRLAPGMEADVIVVDTSAVGMFPLNNPIGTLIYGTRPSDVRTVFVRGAPVKRDGSLVGVDLPKLRDLAASARDRVLDGSGLEPGFAWRLDSEAWSAPATHPDPA